MSIKKFRFVSPGIFVNEIDRSQLPRTAIGAGPVVIGRAARGPAMIPVTVNSYLEFVEKFGEPSRGAASEDVWRSGQTTSPLYAVYAAKAYLRNSAPLTFVRVVGEQSPNAAATSDAQAGWNTGKTSASSSVTDNGGAFGLFLAPSGSSVTGTLAAVWYINTGSIRLVGNNSETAASVGSNGTAVLVNALNNTTKEFRAQVIGTNSTVVLDTTFNFSETSSKYIRKAFNTNPTLTNSSITTTDARETYWLGETFATAVSETITSTGSIWGFIAPVQTATKQLNNFTGKEAESAKTGWVISQDFNSITSSYAADSMPKLFRFVAGVTPGGEHDQRKSKNLNKRY